MLSPGPLVIGADVSLLVSRLLDVHSPYMYTHFAADAVLIMHTHLLQYRQFYQHLTPLDWRGE